MHFTHHLIIRRCVRITLCQAASDSRARLHRQNSGAAYPSRSGLKKAGFPTEIYERFGSMQRAFLAIDTDRSGRIRADELRAMARKWPLPADYVELGMDAVDTDRDGTLDFGEFARHFGGSLARAPDAPARPAIAP